MAAFAPVEEGIAPPLLVRRPSKNQGPMWSEVLLVAAGGAVALVGQALAAQWTTRRERRADFVAALDKVVGAFADGERVLDDLTDAIERGGEALAFYGEETFPAFVEEALAHAERTRVQMRAALFSIRIRVRSDSQVFRAFDLAFTQWDMGFLKSKIIVREDGTIPHDLPEARRHAGNFRGEFYDVALERAADLVGRLKDRRSFAALNVASQWWKRHRAKPPRL